MNDLLSAIPNVLSYVSLVVIILLYFLSLKKCFLKKGRIAGLLITSLLFNPVTIYLLCLSIIGLFLGSLIVLVSGIYIRNTDHYLLLVTAVTSVVFILLMFLLSRINAKRLKVPDKRFVTFVTLMYSVLFLLSIKNDLTTSSDHKTLFSSFIDTSSYLIIMAAGLLLYHFVITPLSKLTDRPLGTGTVGTGTKYFILPPTIFMLIYEIAAMGLLVDDNSPRNQFIINFFSSVILFLFIWAFYVIIININATNEAVEAKNIAAEMARQEARIEADLSIARAIQTSALPRVFPAFPERHEFELFASMNAAKEVGGDFYDFYMLDDRTLGFLIADVSGKSIPGAMFMMTSKTVIKNLAESGLPPAEVFTLANGKLCEGNEAEMFVTAWLGYLDLGTGLVRIANAGHNPAVLIREGKAEYVKLKPGLMLAGMEGMRYKEQTLQLQKGDILYLYTDGVTEAMDRNDCLYGEKRLQDLLSFGDNYPEPSAENGTAESVCAAVNGDLAEYTDGAEQSDDITMLCIRYLGGK